MKSFFNLVFPSILCLGCIIGAILAINIWHYLLLVILSAYAITPVLEEKKERRVKSP